MTNNRLNHIWNRSLNWRDCSPRSEFAVRSTYMIVSDREEARHCEIRTHPPFYSWYRKENGDPRRSAFQLVSLAAVGRCCLPHSAFLFPSCNATIRVRDSLENNTPSSLSPARRCGGERNSSSQFGVPRHSSMTVRLTYAVNYANSYSVRSSDFKRGKREQIKNIKQKEKRKRRDISAL